MFVYRLLIIIFSPLIFSHLLWKSLRLKQPRYLVQRLGFGLQKLPEGCLWFHCASVGETNAVLPLIYELHTRHDDLNFLITTNTTTGAEIVEHQNQDWLFHAYLPMDWTGTTGRFIRQLSPLGLYIVETELWPNLIDAFYHHQIPVFIINGRLSVKTTHANVWVKSVYKRVLNHINHIYVRSEVDRELYIKLGAVESRVSNIGNLKFSPPINNHITRQQLTNRDYIVLASTHEGEELLLVKCWNQLNRKELLVIAPRHPVRSKQIQNQLEKISLHIAVRSKDDVINEKTQIYLLDTVGELGTWYPDAKLVIVAGSFIHHGGHNILEPAHFGKAIVFGPHMESFVDEYKLLLSRNAAIQVDSVENLTHSLAEILESKSIREQLEKNAANAVKPYANIVSDYADVISPLYSDN